MDQIMEHPGNGKLLYCSEEEKQSGYIVIAYPLNKITKQGEK